MAQYNLKQYQHIIYNGKPMSKVEYNGKVVWEASSGKIALIHYGASPSSSDNDWLDWFEDNRSNFNEPYSELDYELWSENDIDNKDFSDVRLAVVLSNDGNYTAINNGGILNDLNCHIISMSRHVSRNNLNMGSLSGNRTNRFFIRTVQHHMTGNSTSTSEINMFSSDTSHETLGNLADDVAPILQDTGITTRWTTAERIHQGKSRVHMGMWDFSNANLIWHTHMRQLINYLNDRGKPFNIQYHHNSDTATSINEADNFHLYHAFRNNNIKLFEFTGSDVSTWYKLYDGGSLQNTTDRNGATYSWDRFLGSNVVSYDYLSGAYPVTLSFREDSTEISGAMYDSFGDYTVNFNVKLN